MKNFFTSRFFLRIVLPAMMAILLFIISVFAFIIPTSETNAVRQKRIMLQELTNTAWSILDKYHRDETAGKISSEEARQLAINDIEALRYGEQDKDYFWITDMTPTMIMHPYVHELMGKSLQEYSDPDGKRLFIEAVEIARTQGEGFINYKWQFMDDSTLIVPKLSFVKKFTPWDWIIGTGIYLDDVQAEISSLTNKLILILLGITVIISLIIFFVTWQSFNIENKRLMAEKQLHESREKYKSLVESSTEGIILLLNGEISYTNSFIQNWLQYTSQEFLEIKPEDLFAPGESPDLNLISIESRFEVTLKRKEGTFAEALLTALPVSFAEKKGILLTFSDRSEHRTVKTEIDNLKARINQIADVNGTGLFRLPISGDRRLTEFNDHIAAMLGYKNAAALKSLAITDILADKSDFKNLLKAAKIEPVIKKNIRLRKKDGKTINANLTLILTRDSSGKELYCDGFLKSPEPVSSENDISMSLLNLTGLFATGYRKVSEHCTPPVTCPPETSLRGAIEIMTRHNSSYVLLYTGLTYIGILTRHLITEILSENDNPLDRPASEFMSAPLVYIDSNACISEAVFLMENKKASHLLVKGHAGIVTGVFERKILTDFILRLPEGIKTSIAGMHTISELANARRRIPSMLKPLVSNLGETWMSNRIISEFNEQITVRIIEDSILETGPPPVAFSFISFGSAGRRELTFNSDQDNAIIFDDTTGVPVEDSKKYFLHLAGKICRRLDESGLHNCRGGFMASNEKWCQPLSVWKEYFTDWIVSPEPENILNISVLFDFRHVFGESSLFSELEDHVFDTINGRSAFFYFLAQSVSRFRPPVNVFGNIVTELSSGKEDVVDIKNCIAPLVMFARIYALNGGIRLKGTVERIKALGSADTLSDSTCEETLFQYNFMMRLLLHHQAIQAENNNPVTNAIVMKKMTETEQNILKKIFSQMNGLQEKLSASFMSSYKG